MINQKTGSVKSNLTPMTSYDLVTSNTQLTADGDIKLDYTIPPHKKRTFERYSSASTLVKAYKLYLPARLCAPLIPFPSCVIAYLQSTADSHKGELNSSLGPAMLMCRNDLLREVGIKFSDCTITLTMDKYLSIFEEISYDVAKLHQPHLVLQEKIIQRYTRDSIRLDMLASTHMEEVADMPEIHLPPLDPMLVCLQSLRYRMTDLYSKHSTTYHTETHNDHKTGIRVRILQNNSFIVDAGEGGVGWFMYMSPRVCVMKSSYSPEYAVLPTPYMDYLFTRREIAYNFSIIRLQPEQKVRGDIFTFLESICKRTMNHNVVVEFMKVYEGFMNMYADLKASPECSMLPFLEALRELIKLSNDDQPSSFTQDDFISVLFNADGSNTLSDRMGRSYSLLPSLVHAIHRQSPRNLLECSSLHKFCCYAEIDEDRATDHFLARVHTKRPVDPYAIIEMSCLFTQIYTISYCRKNGRRPNYLIADISQFGEIRRFDPGSAEYATELSKIEVVSKALKRHQTDTLLTYPLMWWRYLHPYDTEDQLDLASPIEQCKDKRSSKEVISHGPYDSEKEIQYIIQHREVGYKEVGYGDPREQHRVTVEYPEPGQNRVLFEYPVMLKNKEREQKSKGRLFGMNTTRMKQTISREMEHVKHILGYFDGNLMTPSDRARKLKLHDMAQTLLSDNTYAIMADIEGHNQSMQVENTALLMTKCGLCYGKEDWSKYSKFFEKLHVFYVYTHLNRVMVSEGQYGGIEGWYNPLWTLHSVLVCRLINHLTSIKVDQIAVYSDDIAMTSDIDKSKGESFDYLLDTICKHFYRFGLILKGSQTMISKYRLTMLRTHYIGGYRTDASLKRMISASIASNPNFHSDILESSGLNSGIMSALELSNTVLTQTVIKWYRYHTLTYNSLVSSLMCQVSDELLFYTLNESTRGLYLRHYNYSGYGFDDMNRHAVIRNLSKMTREQRDVLIKEILMAGQTGTQTEYVRHQFFESLEQRMAEDEGFGHIAFLRACFPLNAGGMGISLLINSAVTGMADGFLKILCTLDRLAKDYQAIRVTFEIMLNNALGYKIRTGPYSRDLRKWSTFVDDNNEIVSIEDKPDETNLLTNQWPTGNRNYDVNQMVRLSLLKYFKSICVNLELKEYINLEDKVSDFKKAIISLMKEKFVYRIANFYAETNVLFILNKLLRKVENTSSFIRSMPDYASLCKSILGSNIYSSRSLYSKPLYMHYERRPGETMTEFLFKRRARMYTNVKFLDVCEPDPNDFLLDKSQAPTGQDIKHRFMTIVNASKYRPSGGKIVRQSPVFGNEALYKGDLSDSEERFNNLHEYLAVKLLSVSKWIIYRSDPAHYFENCRRGTNISKLCDVCLATLGLGPFNELEQHVPLLTSSEVMHRVPYINQEGVSACRTLPNDSIKYKVTFNNKLIRDLHLEDSNIHFDYWKNHAIMRYAVASSLGHARIVFSVASLHVSHLVRDVQFDFLTSIPEGFAVDWDKMPMIKGSMPRLSRIRWISRQLASAEMPAVLVSPRLEEEVDALDQERMLCQDLILSHYAEVRREYIWAANPLFSLATWEPFIEKYRYILEKNDLHTAEDILRLIRDEAFVQLRRPSISDSLLESYKSNLRESVLADRNSSINLRLKLAEELETLIGALLTNSFGLEGSFRRLSEDYDITLNEIFEYIILTLMLEYLLAYDYIRGYWSLDEPQSIGRIRAFHYYAPVLQATKTVLVATSQMLGNRSGVDFTETVSSLFTDICISAKIVRQDAIAVSEVQVRVPDNTRVPIQKSLMVDIHAYRCKSLVVNIRDILMNPDVQTRLKVRSHLVPVYAHADSYKSTMSGDISTVAASTLTHLIRLDCLGPSDIMIDLTAGRGEFSIEATRLGLPVLAKARRTLYTKVRGSEIVEYDDLHDIAMMVNDTEIYIKKGEAERKGGRVVIICDLSYSGDLVPVVKDVLASSIHLGLGLLMRVPLSTKVDRWKEMTTILDGVQCLFIMMEDGDVSHQNTYICILPNKAWGIHSDINNLQRFLNESIVGITRLGTSNSRPCDYFISSTMDLIVDISEGPAQILDFINEIDNCNIYRQTRYLHRYWDNMLAWRMTDEDVGLLTEHQSPKDPIDLTKLAKSEVHSLLKFSNSMSLRRLLRSMNQYSRYYNVEVKDIPTLMKEHLDVERPTFTQLGGKSDELIMGFIMLLVDVIMQDANYSKYYYYAYHNTEKARMRKIRRAYRHRKLLQPVYDYQSDTLYEMMYHNSFIRRILIIADNYLVPMGRNKYNIRRKGRTKEDDESQPYTSEELDKLAESIIKFDRMEEAFSSETLVLNDPCGALSFDIDFTLEMPEIDEKYLEEKIISEDMAAKLGITDEGRLIFGYYLEGLLGEEEEDADW